MNIREVHELLRDYGLIRLEDCGIQVPEGFPFPQTLGSLAYRLHKMCLDDAHFEVGRAVARSEQAIHEWLAQEFQYV